LFGLHICLGQSVSQFVIMDRIKMLDGKKVDLFSRYEIFVMLNQISPFFIQVIIITNMAAAT